VGRISLPLNSNQVHKLSKSLTFSCKKAKQVLHYKPIGSLEEGISEEVCWLKNKKGWK
jgi:hypothetical protein